MPSPAQSTKALLVPSTWLALDAALSPIMGQAILRRFTGAAAPFQVPEFSVLRTILAQQSDASAAVADAVLLEAFYDLLNKLIGPSLSDRLLSSVCESLSSGQAAQDTSP